MAAMSFLAAASQMAMSVLAPTILLYVGYYVFFHPLRHFPGPFIAKFSDLYGAYFSYYQVLHFKTLDNFKQYGTVFRQGPNRLVFNSPTAIRDIYLNPRVAKGESYDHVRLTSSHPHIVNTTDRQSHRKKRRIIAPVLNERSMRIFEPTMLVRIDQLHEKLSAASDSGTSVNMSDLSVYLALDIIGDLAFGYPFNTQTEETNRFIPEVFHTITGAINNIMQMRMVKPFHLVGLALSIKQMKKFRQAMGNMVAQRIAKDKHAVHDFYSVAATEMGGVGDEFFKTEFWPEAGNFLVAGGSTIASALAGTFFYLSRYPEHYEKLATEIRSTFGSLDEIQTGPKLAGCKYLRACIEETMRCVSPVTTILWRCLDPQDTSTQPLIVDGHVIPPGVQVGISLYSVLHSEDIFPDPFLYNPERWLDNDEEDDTTKENSGFDEDSVKKLMRQCLIPFAAGDRVCAGKPMAWAEMTLTIARTIWLFDFDPAPKDQKMHYEVFHQSKQSGKSLPVYRVLDTFTAQHDGPNLLFQRKRASKS